MLKLKSDFKCVLVDKKTGENLLVFNAQQVGDPVYNAGFEGGGIASASQAMTIMTETSYKYNALQHNVMIGERRWIITSVTPAMRRRLGSGAVATSKTVYLLSLE